MNPQSLSAVTASMRASKSAARIIELHLIVERAKVSAVAWARSGIEAMIAAGECLIEIRDNLADGDWGEWLDSLIQSLPEDCSFSRRTAYNYIRAVRFKSTLEDEFPAFHSVRELYIASGIMPQPPSSEPPGERPPPLYCLTWKPNATPPEQWEPMDRREFLEKAKPIIDLYERVQAAESAESAA
jgi:hypothetical protein